MAEEPSALLEHYTKMRQELLGAIDGLSDELMAEPSIDGWSVKDHLLHIAFWDDLRADEVLRISAGHVSAWRMTGEQDEVLNNLGYEMRRGMSLAQARWEFAHSRERLMSAIASAPARAMDPAMYGEAGLRSSHEEQHAGWIRRWRGEKGV